MERLHIRLILACVLLVLPESAMANELATSASGRKVLLKDDGTWTYLDNSAPKTSSRDRNGEDTIGTFCLSEWHDDFAMRAYCEKKQRDAVRALALGRPTDIAENEFAMVRRHCAGEWPNDFSMRAYCEQKQFTAIRDLRH